MKATRLLFFLLLVLGFMEPIFAQKNCNNYHNGKFKLVDASSNVTYIIERKGSLQTESIVGTTDKLDFIVNWIDDCTYSLTPTKKTQEFLKSDLVVYTKIIGITTNELVLLTYLKDVPNSEVEMRVQIMN
ncbi:MAG: hypothetical protein RLZZ500_962 [Bacteroidota bacterium]